MKNINIQLHIYLDLSEFLGTSCFTLSLPIDCELPEFFRVLSQKIGNEFPLLVNKRSAIEDAGYLVIIRRKGKYVTREMIRFSNIASMLDYQLISIDISFKDGDEVYLLELMNGG